MNIRIHIIYDTTAEKFVPRTFSPECVTQNSAPKSPFHNCGPCTQLRSMTKLSNAASQIRAASQKQHENGHKIRYSIFRVESRPEFSHRQALPKFQILKCNSRLSSIRSADGPTMIHLEKKLGQKMMKRQ
jgi:hypothetical protein